MGEVIAWPTTDRSGANLDSLYDGMASTFPNSMFMGSQSLEDRKWRVLS